MEVLIANPIYDVVFKYMLEDNAVAKLLISSIIGEEVIELEPKPQEHTTEKVKIDDKDSSITVYRLDFSAKIKIPSGYKLIHIEMQKASLPTDIMRFRRYLGEQYINPSNSIITPDGIEGLQIYCLYFLGKGLGESKAPVIMVNPDVREIATSEAVTERFGFIESLHHKAWIVQINNLKDRRRNELEKLLAIFDQSNITADWHILNVSEEDFPEKFRPVIRRLKSAASNSKVKRQMKTEDEFLRYLQDCVRVEREKDMKKLEENKKTIEENKKALEEKDKTIEENKKALEEKNKTIEENKKTIEEQAAKIAELERLMKITT